MPHHKPGIHSRTGPGFAVQHRLPNRLRLDIPVLCREPFSDRAGVLAQALEHVVESLGGVDRAQANVWTGSLLVEHDGAPGQNSTGFGLGVGSASVWTGLTGLTGFDR